MDYSNATNEELENLVSQKNGDAICELAERCMYGTKGHEKNLTRAYQLFHKGEKLGVQGAYLGLAKMYENGIGCARSEKIASEYYQKAGVQKQDVVSKEEVKTHETTQSKVTSTITTSDIRQKIEKAEMARKQENYFLVKQECNEALKMIDGIATGAIPYTGQDDVDVLRIDTYWVLAFTAFNEQQTDEMDRYLSQEGVQALHPWGAYIAAVTHRSRSFPDAVLEQDLQTLIAVSENQNLTSMEKGDVTMMIAELIREGHGTAFGCSPQMAYDYYAQSAACGNAYAQEQLANF